jgi:hypothetical protein
MNGEGAVFFFPFYFLYCIFLFIFFLLFYFLSFYFYFIQFLTSINFLMFVLIRKRLLLVLDRCFDVKVWGTPWILHSSVPYLTVIYFLPHWKQCII